MSGNSSAYNNAYKEELRNNGVYNPLKYEPKSESTCATPLVLERSKKQTCCLPSYLAEKGLNRKPTRPLKSKLSLSVFLARQPTRRCRWHRWRRKNNLCPRAFRWQIDPVLGKESGFFTVRGIAVRCQGSGG